MKKSNTKSITITIDRESLDKAARDHIKHFISDKYRSYIDGVGIERLFKNVFEEMLSDYMNELLNDNKMPLMIMTEQIVDRIAPGIVSRMLDKEYMDDFLKEFKLQISDQLTKSDEIKKKVDCYIESSFPVLVQSKVEGLFDKMIQAKVTKTVYLVLEDLRKKKIIKV